MFFIELTYKQPLAIVEKYLPEHNIYLDNNYSAGNFIFSGRKEPRTGGVILANVATTEALEAIYQHDPFFVHKVADYRIIKFMPTKTDSIFGRIVVK
jgi:uncharacterized protein YciI